MNRILSYWAVIALLGLTMLAAGLRYESASETVVDTPIRADALDYYFAAVNLKEHFTLSKQPFNADPAFTPQPDALRPPLYSLFLLPVVEYPPTESMISKIIFAQVLMSTLLIPMLFFALRGLVPDSVNLLIAAFVACSPHLIVVNSYVLTESIYTFSIGLLICTLAMFIKRTSLLLALLLGATVALSALIRPTSLYLIPFLVIGILLFQARSQSIRYSLFIALGFALVYSPWSVRNMVSDIAPTRSLASDTLQKGMYPGLMYKNDPRTYGYPNRYDPEWSRRSKSTGLVLDEIYQRFKDQPSEYFRWYMLGKPITFLSWNIVVGAGDVFIYPVKYTPIYESPGLKVAYTISKLSHWPHVALAVLGVLIFFLPSVVRVVRPQPLLFFRMASVIFLYFVLVHVVGTPLPRYSIPIKPLVFVLSMSGLYCIISVIRAGRIEGGDR